MSFVGRAPRLLADRRRVLGQPASTPTTCVQDAGCAGRRPTAAACAIRPRSSHGHDRGSRSTSASRPACATSPPSGPGRPRRSTPAPTRRRAAEQGEARRAGAADAAGDLSATERAVYILREAFEYPHRRIAAAARAQRGERPPDRHPRAAPDRGATPAGRSIPASTRTCPGSSSPPRGRARWPSSRRCCQDSAPESSRRELMSSLPNTLRRWYSTVRGLMNSCAPISGFV